MSVVDALIMNVKDQIRQKLATAARRDALVSFFESEGRPPTSDELAATIALISDEVVEARLCRTLESSAANLEREAELTAAAAERAQFKIDKAAAALAEAETAKSTLIAQAEELHRQAAMYDAAAQQVCSAPVELPAGMNAGGGGAALGATVRVEENN